MPDAPDQLTPEAKRAVRGYLRQIALLFFAVFGGVNAIVIWQLYGAVQDVARSKGEEVAKDEVVKALRGLQDQVDAFRDNAKIQSGVMTSQFGEIEQSFGTARTQLNQLVDDTNQLKHIKEDLERIIKAQKEDTVTDLMQKITNLSGLLAQTKSQDLQTYLAGLSDLDRKFKNLESQCQANAASLQQKLDETSAQLKAAETEDKLEAQRELGLVKQNIGNLIKGESLLASDLSTTGTHFRELIEQHRALRPDNYYKSEARLNEAKRLETDGADLKAKIGY